MSLTPKSSQPCPYCPPWARVHTGLSASGPRDLTRKEEGSRQTGLRIRAKKEYWGQQSLAPKQVTLHTPREQPDLRSSPLSPDNAEGQTEAQGVGELGGVLGPPLICAVTLSESWPP